MNQSINGLIDQSISK